ncbi:MAG: HEAT repeat domain-containing protein [Thermoanaerobaculia bacterium]
MSKRAWRNRAVVFIALALVLTLAAACRKGEEGPPPTAKPVTPAPAPPLFPNTPAGRAADATVRKGRGIGPGAEAAYQASLQQLRSNGVEAVNVLFEGYRSADPADYPTRSVVVEILAELGQPEALPALTQIARSPVPKPARVPHHALNPYVEESIIRVVAIRGIGTYATNDRQAQDTLIGLLRSDASAVREEAARALWAATMTMEDVQRREAIRNLIPVPLRVDPELKRGPVAPER